MSKQILLFLTLALLVVYMGCSDQPTEPVKEDTNLLSENFIVGKATSTSIVANAGPDQTVYTLEESALVNLNGKGSTEDDNVDEYVWRVYDNNTDPSKFTKYWGLKPTVILYPGTTRITLTVYGFDYTVEVTDEVMITVVKITTSIVANAGPDQTVYTQDEPASITLDGTGSTQDNNLVKNYIWRVYDTGEPNPPKYWGLNPTIPLNFGIYKIELTVLGYIEGEKVTDEVMIKVVEIRPPELIIKLIKAELWPPNNKMQLAASVRCYDPTHCGYGMNLELNVISNEDENSTGNRDIIKDWNIVSTSPNPDTTWVYLRAERDGKGDGRIYTIIAKATNEFLGGIYSTAEATVIVPKSKVGRRK